MRYEFKRRTGKRGVIDIPNEQITGDRNHNADDARRRFVLTPKANSMKKFNGKAIYQPSGKAGEYAEYACNFYVGCSNGCE